MKRLIVLACGALTALSLAAAEKPNIILILADDLGFSDVGCYGGEIQTPNIDRLAARGLRFTQFYNVARCCPSRAALMTGLHPHQAHVGDMVDEYARGIREQLNTSAYSDRLNPNAPTIAEALRQAGYRTGMSGKWHLGYRTNEWPSARGFDRSFAVIEGAMNYYGYGMQHTGIITNPPMVLDHAVYIPPREGFFATDAFTDYAVRFINESATDKKPFFLYLAYTEPHWPLHAKPENIAKHRGRYRTIGWDKLREHRYERLKLLGIIDARWPLAPRPVNVRPWEQATPERQAEWDEEMAVYAAQVEELDHGIGQVMEVLSKVGREENTLVMFLSDNGGAAEDPNRSLPGSILGARESYRGYGIGGAHVSSSPFRKTKKFIHEGGIAAPLILCWPSGMPHRGQLTHTLSHIIDLMPTCLDVAGASFPKALRGVAAWPLEGISLAPLFKPGQTLSRSQPLFWEHEGHTGVRNGKWKLVATFGEPWELYDMEADRTELNNLAELQPQRVRELRSLYQDWARRVGVEPWPGRPPSPAPKKPFEKSAARNN